MIIIQKRVFAVLVFISLVYFLAFLFPNNTGARDQMMISLFEPDEFAQYPIVMKMLTPREELDKTILNFVAYRHYYYGSPFYFSSAFLLMPIALLDNLRQTTQLNMLLLRQFISILPMLGGLLLLTYIQTKFNSYLKSIGLFIFLLSVSAVVENSLWWHVDSLAFFFVALTLFFLDRDNLRFERDFTFAAIATGLATGTKVIGLFFFLAIPVYLLAGLILKRITWRTLLIRAVLFVTVMTVSIVISNPYLLIPSQAARMIRIMGNQSAAMSVGWTLSYDKGPASWLPILESLYGKPAFIGLALLALLLGIWKSNDRVRHLVIASWAIPFGLYVLFTIAIKPTHFFLPILLPVYSSAIILFDLPPFSNPPKWKWAARAWGVLFCTILGYQFTTYLQKDVELYRGVMTREEQSKPLIFYRTIEADYLSKIELDERIVVFRDVRMYVPESSKWVLRTYWNSDYATIEQIKPEVIVLWSQRILDYTQDGARENAIDPVSFEDTYQFYVDADNDQLQGYRLLYRDSVGLLFVTEEIYERFFKP